MQQWLLLTIVLQYSKIISSTDIPWPPLEGYFNQTVDHFNFNLNQTKIFKQRFLYHKAWFKPAGPIFLYCGNEGSIDVFWNNTGFMFEIAPSFNAFVVFVEHRYYGKSLPFERSFEQPYIKYLSVSQVLVDYVYFIDYLKTHFSLQSSPVIAFGGSYGGILAAMMRVKYPHLVLGALASSAPVRWVIGEGRFHEFFEAVSKDFYQVNSACFDCIKNSFQLALELSKNDTGLQKLSTGLNLCHPITSMDDFYWVLKWARNAFVMMAMFDYPYSSSFTSDLTPNPVNVSCLNALREKDPITSLKAAISVYYSNNQDSGCFDYKSQYMECADITGCGLGNDSLAWDFQSCTEMNLYDDSDSTKEDMFVSLPLTKAQLIKYCRDKWGVEHKFDQLKLLFGADIWKYASNIIFSNGDLDPWAGGSILTQPSDKVVLLTLNGGAHHLDLRSPNKDDPPSAQIVRQSEIQTIESWLHPHFPNIMTLLKVEYGSVISMSKRRKRKKYSTTWLELNVY